MSDDLISRRAALSACHNWDDGKNYYAYGDTVEERLQKLPSAQPDRQWIPVSERLPEPYQHIIATVRYIGWNGEEYNRVVHKAYGGESNILAWMPIPEPWKGEEDE